MCGNATNGSNVNQTTIGQNGTTGPNALENVAKVVNGGIEIAKSAGVSVSQVSLWKRKNAKWITASLQARVRKNMIFL